MSTYIQTDWVNETTPAINDTNLNHAEIGTADAHDEIETIALGNVSVKEAATADKARFIQNASQTVIGGVKAYTVIDSSTGEVGGVIVAPEPLDPPQPITDLEASDNLPGVIRITFTRAVDSLYHDLYRDDVIVATNISPGFMYRTEAGTWAFRVRGHNFVGFTDSIKDSGTAKAIPTAPPAPIVDFEASDNKAFKVIMTWTDHGDVFKFDLYRNNVLIADRVDSGYEHVLNAEDTASYYVIATNYLGTTKSNTDTGTSLGLQPMKIVDFKASDALTNLINITFSYIPQPCTYDLYRDDILWRSNVQSDDSFNSMAGTESYFIRAVNNLGFADSNPNTGTAVASKFPPGEITDFDASDDRRREIRIFFTPAVDAGRHDLYAGDSKVGTDVVPGEIIDTGGAGTWLFYVKAVNSRGSIDSNSDSGTAIAALTGPPVWEVNDFVVSDSRVNQLLIMFTRAVQGTSYVLLKEGKIYKTEVSPGDLFSTFAGTWGFRIIAHNLLGSALGGTDDGTALPSNDAPSKIENFNASDGFINRVVSTFTLADNAARHDLYRGDLKISTDVDPGHIFYTRPGTWSFHVKAINLVDTIDSNHEEGTAIATEQPPVLVTDDFLASNLNVPEIIMTWSPFDGALSYDLYKDGLIEVTGVLPGYVYPSLVAGSWTFHVVANNDNGATPSRTDIGSCSDTTEPPSEIIDFAASNLTIGAVIMTWSASVGATSYDLYKDGAIIEIGVSTGYSYSVEAGTNLYKVIARNAAGDVFSNSDWGTSLEGGGGGSEIVFTASNNAVQFINMTWTDDGSFNYYMLYQTPATLISSDAITPYSLDMGEDGGAATYFVSGQGPGGDTTSNTDDGFAYPVTDPEPPVLVPGSVTLMIDEMSGDTQFITGTGPNYTFDGTLTGYDVFDICIVGGGGGGGGDFSTYGGGGGGSGAVIDTSADLTFSIIIGDGGAYGSMAGESTVVAGIVALGGGSGNAEIAAGIGVNGGGNGGESPYPSGSGQVGYPCISNCDGSPSNPGGDCCLMSDYSSGGGAGGGGPSETDENNEGGKGTGMGGAGSGIGNNGLKGGSGKCIISWGQ